MIYDSLCSQNGIKVVGRGPSSEPFLWANQCSWQVSVLDLCEELNQVAGLKCLIASLPSWTYLDIFTFSTTWRAGLEIRTKFYVSTLKPIVSFVRMINVSTPFSHPLIGHRHTLITSYTLERPCWGESVCPAVLSNWYQTSSRTTTMRSDVSGGPWRARCLIPGAIGMWAN